MHGNDILIIGITYYSLHSLSDIVTINDQFSLFKTGYYVDMNILISKIIQCHLTDHGKFRMFTRSQFRSFTMKKALVLTPRMTCSATDITNQFGKKLKSITFKSPQYQSPRFVCVGFYWL